MHQFREDGDPSPYRSVFIVREWLRVQLPDGPVIRKQFRCNVDGCILRANSLGELHAKIDQALDQEY